MGMPGVMGTVGSPDVLGLCPDEEGLAEIAGGNPAKNVYFKRVQLLKRMVSFTALVCTNVS
jgi:hypothetical protein